MVAKLPLPSLDFTRRTMCLSTIRCRKRAGIKSTNCSPRRMRMALSGSMMDFSAPGRPRPVPLITTEPRGVAFRS